MTVRLDQRTVGPFPDSMKSKGHHPCQMVNSGMLGALRRHARAAESRTPSV